MNIQNKQAHRDYTLLETFEAGIVLNGAEVKAIRGKHASIDGAHIRIMNGEAYLVNAKIYPYQFANDGINPHEETRRRKLLLHKKELLMLKSKLDNGKNMALVPTSIYLKNKRFKVAVSLAKGKKEYEKRSDIKKRDIDRQVAQELKKWG